MALKDVFLDWCEGKAGGVADTVEKINPACKQSSPVLQPMSRDYTVTDCINNALRKMGLK